MSKEKKTVLVFKVNGVTCQTPYSKKQADKFKLTDVKYEIKKVDVKPKDK